MKNEDKSFEKQWRQHRFLTRVVITGFVAGCFFLFLACTDSFAPFADLLLLPAACVTIAAYLIAYAFLMFWKCPCCGQNFYGWTRDTAPGFSSGCQNCGLRRNEGAGLR